MYPLKFAKEFKEKVWGGRSFNTLLGMKLPDNKLYGESWEVSTHPNGTSIITQGDFKGKSLVEVLENHRVEILGRDVVDNYGKKFPLLVKFLDINDKLSIQVHPDNDYAMLNEGELGKEESWYVMNASPDAEIIMGFKPGVTEAIFENAYSNGELDTIFNRIKVKTGDVINIKPGTVHGTYAGSILICEVQQNSDVTYRVFDYDRLVNGKKRDLHLKKSKEVFNYACKPDLSRNGQRKITHLDNAILENLVSCDLYTMDKISISGLYNDGIHKNFRIYSVLEGSGEVIFNGIKYILEAGETYFIPAGLKIVILGKNITILKIYL